MKENAGADFPLLKLCAPELANINAEEVKQSIIDTILGVQYKDRSCAAALSLIQDSINLKTEEFHVDHIYPQSLTNFAEFIAARKELMRKKLRADLDKIA